MREHKAKVHSVLQDLISDLCKGRIEDTVEVYGRRWTMHTLNEDEETWADAFLRAPTPSALISSRRAPRLAAAITAINEIPIDQIFMYPADMKKEVIDRLNSNPIEKAYWLRDQMLYFLSEDGNRPFVMALYAKFLELEERREKGISEIPKS